MNQDDIRQFEQDRETIAAATPGPWEVSGTASIRENGGLLVGEGYGIGITDSRNNAKALAACRERWPIAIETALRVPGLEQRIATLESAIVAHRSQKADDRCIEDDDRLYEALGDGIKCDRRVGSKEDMLANCQRFIERRCEGGGWPSYAELQQRIGDLQSYVESLKTDKHALFEDYESALTAERARAQGLAEQVERLRGLLQRWAAAIKYSLDRNITSATLTEKQARTLLDATDAIVKSPPVAHQAQGESDRQRDADRAEIVRLRKLLDRCLKPLQFALQQSWAGSQADLWLELRDQIDTALASSAREPQAENAP